MTYQAWTAKAVEHRVLEAAETLMLTPNVQGPKCFGSAMPEPVQGRMDAYGSDRARYRRQPSPGALDRMEECWTWINALPEKADRVLLYSWAWVKARKGMKISRFAAENEMNDRTLRREITRICQVIANDLNRLRTVRLTMADCAVSENQVEADATTVSSVKYATHWMAPDGKPQIDPALSKTRVLDNRRRRAG